MNTRHLIARFPLQASRYKLCICASSGEAEAVEVVCFFQISGGLLVLVISKGLCLPDCLSVWHLVGGERLWLAA